MLTVSASKSATSSSPEPLGASVKDDTATKNGQTEERNINFETERKK